MFTPFKNALARCLPKKMWAQMAVILVALVGIPLLAMGWLLILQSQNAVKVSVLRDHEQLAVRSADSVAQFFQRPRDLLTSTASILGTLHSDPWREETVLVQLALDQDIFGRLSLIMPDGAEAATSDLGSPLKNFSLDPSFRRALHGAFAMSRVRFADDHMPYVTMAVPVRQLGKVTSVLEAQVSLRGLWGLVDGIRIGRTGRAFVVSARGTLIAHPDKKKVLSNADLSDSLAVSLALQGRVGGLEEQTDGGRQLEAFAPVPGLGWGLVISQSTAEAYAFSDAMKTESWVLILLSVLIAIGVSIAAGYLFVRPLKLLAEKTRLVAEGDFDQHLPVTRQDEMGDLIRAFNRMADHLKRAREAERLTAIGKAATAIAHELKNSLIMASTYIGLLPKRYEDRQFLEKFITVVPQELDNWKMLLRDMSDFSRPSKFDLEALDLYELLENFRPFIGEEIARNRIRLEISAPEGLPAVHGNRQKLKQVLVNLAMNAIDAMPGGGTLRITAEKAASEEGSAVEIRVEDSGKGIPSDRLKHIFEPFYVKKQNGLGLAICRGIVEQHGGRIEAESQLGKGSAFIIRLPASESGI